jgi:hypothetical protein
MIFGSHCLSQERSAGDVDDMAATVEGVEPLRSMVR